MPAPRQLVVGAAVISGGRVLAARRVWPESAHGRWELPGGKVEPGEDPAAALVREVREELGCTVRVTGRLPGEQPISTRFALRVLLARLVSGEPVPREHDAVRWLTLDQLDDVDWLDADRPFLRALGSVLADGAEAGVPRHQAPPSRVANSMRAMDQRLLLVHAHPDDETIGQGATMASYVARGTQVTLVTCTLGEEGEILVPELEHLAADREDGLGRHRVTELASAMKELGVTDHRFLGGAGRFRDSGMVWHESGHAVAGEDVKDGTFWKADLLEAADLLVEIIREVRPQVLVTYDQFGGYGHPDHIQAHRVATYATALAAVPTYRPELGGAWDIVKVYWSATSRERMREGLRAMRAAGDTTTFEGMDPEGELPPFFVPEELLSAEVDAAEFVDAKMRAMKAHASQIAVDGPFFALADQYGNSMWGIESYRLAKGVQGPTDERGLETDLFAGL